MLRRSSGRARVSHVGDLSNERYNQLSSAHPLHEARDRRRRHTHERLRLPARRPPAAAPATVGAKRRLDTTAVPPTKATNAGAAAQDAFNEQYLKYYYKHLFPYNAMFRWFAYGNGARWRG